MKERRKYSRRMMKRREESRKNEGELKKVGRMKERRR